MEVNRQNIVHILEDSITILNTSRLEISKNRHTINDILETISAINNKISNVTKELSSQIIEVENFLQMYLKLDLIVEELKHSMQNGLVLLENLKLQINMLSTEKLSPLIISPVTLKATLKNIATKLPREFRLPDNEDKNLWKYYTYLRCATVVTNNQIIIVVFIPILDFSSQFEVYNVHNYPVALANTSQRTENSNLMTAQIDLDSYILALNNERTKYIILNQMEAQKCSNPWQSFCEFQSPVYSVSLHESCVISLFLNQTKNINKYCKTVVNLDTKLPRAEFIGHGNWLVATSKLLHFSIVCHNKAVSSALINPPVGILHVQTSCMASNSFFSLVSPFDGRSRYKLKDTMSEFMTIPFHKINLNLWKPLQLKFPNMSEIRIPDKLKDNKQIPMGNLIRELHNVRPIQSEKQGVPSWVYFLFITITALVFIALIVLFCKCKHRMYTYWLARRVANGQRKSGSPLSSPHNLAMESYNGKDSAIQLAKQTPYDDERKPEISSERGKKTPNIDVLSA